jgi:hypothetical protein
MDPHAVTMGLAYAIYLGLVVASVTFVQIRVRRPGVRVAILVMLALFFAAMWIPYLFIGPCMLDRSHCV